MPRQPNDQMRMQGLSHSSDPLPPTRKQQQTCAGSSEGHGYNTHTPEKQMCTGSRDMSIHLLHSCLTRPSGCRETCHQEGPRVEVVGRETSRAEAQAPMATQTWTRLSLSCRFPIGRPCGCDRRGRPDDGLGRSIYFCYCVIASTTTGAWASAAWRVASLAAPGRAGSVSTLEVCLNVALSRYRSGRPRTFA